MMSAFKLHTLKQKLWAIVATSLIFRIIVLFSLPNTPTNLAPDESAYSEITRRISTGEALEQLAGLSRTSQTLVFPAVMFVKIGLDPLAATRLSALMYGIASLVFVAHLINKVAYKHVDIVSKDKNMVNLALIVFSVYAFLPSHLLWSTLALRESTVEFWVLLIFGSVFLVMHHSERLNRLSYLVLISSVFLLFNTRHQVGLIVVVSIMISLPFLFKVRNAQKIFIMVAITSALSFGSLFIQIKAEFKTVNLDEATANVRTADPGLCKKNGQIILIKSSRFLCVETRKLKLEEITRPDEFFVGQVTSIQDRQKTNQANSLSPIKTPSCPFEDKSEISEITCLIWRAPYMSITFLIRPIIGLDVTNRLSLFAALENLLWSAGFIFAFYLIAKKRKLPFSKPLFPSVLFFLLYSVGAGSYEGNLGTAVRHKSLILWVILLVVFALAWRKLEEVLKKSSSNSQESAV